MYGCKIELAVYDLLKFLYKIIVRNTKNFYLIKYHCFSVKRRWTDRENQTRRRKPLRSWLQTYLRLTYSHILMQYLSFFSFLSECIIIKLAAMLRKDDFWLMQTAKAHASLCIWMARSQPLLFARNRYGPRENYKHKMEVVGRLHRFINCLNFFSFRSYFDRPYINTPPKYI